jgi:nucleotide-binding universal stress UspA family protein
VKEILVPVDGSDTACRAARFAAELAQRMGAKVTLLHAYDAPTVAQLGLHNLPKPQLEAALQHVARGSFDRALGAIGEIQVPVEERVVVGHPATEILAHIHSQRPDLIVMGSRGLSPLRGRWLGSVSQAVLRMAEVPVTIVRDTTGVRDG